MLQLNEFMNLHLLKKEGLSIREIARRCGYSRNTVRKLLRKTALPTAQRRHRPSCLDPFKDYLRQRYGELGLSAVRLRQEIRSMGFAGSVILVRRFLRQLEPPAARPNPKLTVRYETAPGRQAQCDWAEVGRYALADGRRVYVYLFVMVLSYSRLLYIEFTTSMRREALIAAHQRAFDYFAGVPQSILYDNQKQVITCPGHFDATFADFAAHCAFSIKVHRPYRPRTKGKVERMVLYVKDNFLRGRHFDGLEDLNAQGALWLQEANGRCHGTTGRIPRQAAQEENLQSWLPSRPWTPTVRLERRVNAEALVHVESSRYSVPAQFCGKVVQVEVCGQTLSIHHAEQLVATHPRATHAGSLVERAEHVRQRWQQSGGQAGTSPRAEARPLCRIDFAQDLQVAHRPLSQYEDILN